MSCAARSGFAIFDTPYDEAACLAGDGTAGADRLGTIGDTVTHRLVLRRMGLRPPASPDGDGKLTELDTYAIPEAHDPAFADRFRRPVGPRGGHVPPGRRPGYFSYYAGGFRVVADRRTTSSSRRAHFIDEGGNNFWGVQVFEHDGVEYVAASDRDFGLYIFRYTGP